MLFMCRNLDCEHVFYHQPNWLDFAHSSSISILDCGAVRRSLLNSLFLATLLFFCRKYPSSYRHVDYGASTGLLVRILRDLSIESLWHDPYSQNIYSQGFEYVAQGQINVVTAFEVLEHIPNPHKKFGELLRKSKPEIVVLQTQLTPNKVSSQWDYLQTLSGQHVSFFSLKSLSKFMNTYGFSIHRVGSRIVCISQMTPPVRSALVIAIAHIARSLSILFFIKYLFSTTQIKKDYLYLKKHLRSRIASQSH